MYLQTLHNIWMVMIVCFTIPNYGASNDVGFVSKHMIRATTNAAFASKGESKTIKTIPRHGTTTAASQLPTTRCGNRQNCSSTTDDSVGNVTPPGPNKSYIDNLRNKVSYFINQSELLCFTYDDPNPVDIKAYDPKLQICCNGLYNRTTQSEQCCNTKVIDSEKRLCCGSVHINKSTDIDCCASTLYFRNVTLCCHGTLVQKTEYSVCCGDRVISEITEICCGGRTFPKALGDDGAKCCGDSPCNGTVPPIYGQTNTSGPVSGGTISPIFGQTNKPGPLSGVAQKGKLNTICGIIAGSVLVIVAIYGATIEYWTNHGLTNGIKQLVVCIVCKRHKKETDADRKSLLHSPEHPITSIQVDPPPDSRSIVSLQYSVSLHVDITLQQFEDDFAKPPYSCPGNILKDHFKDIACQTMSSEKACNRRTVLGQTFEHSCIVDMKNPIFQLPNSEVSVRLPDKYLMQCPIEMHGSSFGDILSIHNKINIPTSEDIASPVVEYLLTSVSYLNDYAVVTVPFIGQKELIRVWKFNSDDGMSTKVEPIEVHRKTKENKDQPLYYEIQGDTARIYTRSFSGFFITKERHNRQDCLNLHAYLFGSHKRISPGRNDVRLRLYIADEIMKFKDFKQDMFKNEECGGRHLLIDQPIALTEEVREEDILEVCFTVNTGEGEQWVHRIHPGTGQPIYPVVKIIKFEDIVTKCPECPNCHFKSKRIPDVVEWYLENSGSISDTFSCLVDINCISGQNQQLNVITVDELLLRQVDRRPVEESNEVDRLEALKDFLVRMDEHDQAKFIKIIKESYGCTGTRIPDMFTDLLRTMKAVGVYEATVATLKLGNLKQQLHNLENKNILEDAYFPKPVQRTGEDASSETDRQRGLVHSNTQRHANGQASHGQSSGQASLGQQGGQASHGQSGGQASLGQPGGQATLGQSVGQATLGQSSDQATLGQSGGQATLGQSGGQATLGQSGGQATLGQSGGQATLGQSVGQTSLGQSGGQATLGQSVGQATLGQSVGQVTLGQSGGQTTIGQSGGQTTLGQSGGQATLGQSGGQTTLGQSGGQATLGQSGGQVTLGQSGGQTTLGQSVGHVTLGQSGGQATLGQSGGQTTLSQSGGQTTLGQSVGQATLGQSGGQTSLGQSGGQVTLGQSGGQATLGQSGGQTTLGQSVGQVTLGQSVGQTTLGQSVGQATLGQSGGQVTLGQPGGQAILGQSGGQATLGQPGGQVTLGQSVGQTSLGKSVGQASFGQSVCQATYAGKYNNVFNVTREYPTGSSAGATGYLKDEIKQSEYFNHDNALCRNELGSDLPVCSYPRAGGDQDANKLGRYVQQSVPTESVELAEWKRTVPVQEHASLDDTFLKQTSWSDTE